VSFFTIKGIRELSGKMMRMISENSILSMDNKTVGETYPVAF